METSVIDLETLRERLGELLTALTLPADDTRLSNDADDPALLIAAFAQLTDVMLRIEREGTGGADGRSDRQAQVSQTAAATELGQFAFDLLDKTERLLGALEPDQQDRLAQLRVEFAAWVATQQGQIHSLEPIVDSVARIANRSIDSALLEQLGLRVLAIIDAAAPQFRQDLEVANPGRPWRLLHLNLGIVATRARSPALMEQAFARLTRHLPQDAPQFFNQGMEQLGRIDYPESVRSVMTKYYQQWSNKPALH